MEFKQFLDFFGFCSIFGETPGLLGQEATLRKLPLLCVWVVVSLSLFLHSLWVVVSLSLFYRFVVGCGLSVIFLIPL